MDNTSALNPACGLNAIGLPPTAFGGLCARHFALATLLVLCAYIVYEQAVFFRNRRTKDGNLIAGPRFVVPIVGCIIEMVMEPYAFWNKQRNFSMPGLSYNSIMGHCMVFVTDPEVSRRIFGFNDPSTLLMGVHPSAKNILGESNLAFMHGPAHKAIRKSFLSLFTRKALNTYVQSQDAVIRDHISLWLAINSGNETEVRDFVRDMNAATSQEVFAGPYLTMAGPAVRSKFTACFIDMTQGFLAFPLCFPGTAVWRARAGRLYILSVIRTAASQSKAAMKEGTAPRCLMDYWAQKCLEEMTEAELKGVPPPGHCSDAAMADTVMDFLFASQDASTASLVWTLCMMADRPEILAKVRDEQAILRPDPEAVISGEVLQQMVYTRQVVREILRFRPPAPMVPQVVQQEKFAITESFTASKGTLIMPSITASSMQGFTDPEKFDPDRFSPERQENVTFSRYFLTFGIGPHACVGREYAINHLVAFLAILSTSADWSRRRTPRSDDWLYLPTVYPADSFITMQPRAPKVLAT